MRTERFRETLESVASLTEAQLDQLGEAVEQRRTRTRALRIVETARDAKRNAAWNTRSGTRGRCERADCVPPTVCWKPRYRCTPGTSRASHSDVL